MRCALHNYEALAPRSVRTMVHFCGQICTRLKVALLYSLTAHQRTHLTGLLTFFGFMTRGWWMPQAEVLLHMPTVVHFNICSVLQQITISIAQKPTAIVHGIGHQYYVYIRMLIAVTTSGDTSLRPRGEAYPCRA